MRKALVKLYDIPVGVLVEKEGSVYEFSYLETYEGPPVSLTMPVEIKSYLFSSFPPFFEGLLPEGIMLEGLLRNNKLDRRDYFGQLLVTGEDLVGAATVHPLPEVDE